MKVKREITNQVEIICLQIGIREKPTPKWTVRHYCYPQLSAHITLIHTYFNKNSIYAHL
jgi:hypothetical protein